MEFELEVKGLKQLDRALKQLPARSAKRAIRSATRAGGREIIKEARKNLRKYNKTKNLSKSLSIKMLRPRQYSITALIGPRVGKDQKYDGWYAHLVEFGVAPHTIKSKKKGVLKLTDALTLGNDQALVKSVEHPGHPAKPFMRPAYDKKKRDSVKAVGEKLWEAIAREAAKLK